MAVLLEPNTNKQPDTSRFLGDKRSINHNHTPINWRIKI